MDGDLAKMPMPDYKTSGGAFGGNGRLSLCLKMKSCMQSILICHILLDLFEFVCRFLNHDDNWTY